MSKISIIVPVYNVELYIHRCVDSILSQTYQDFELILVDDGSPDNCGSVCDEYAKLDNRVVVIHQQNRGVSAARNAGIDWAFANSDSEWITFIDSDDWVYPMYLEKLYFVCSQNNVNIAICEYMRTTGEDVDIQTTESDVKLYTPEDFWCQKEINASVPWGKLYRKELWEELRFPIGVIYEDTFTIYKVLFRFELVYVVEPLYCYRINPSSITQSRWSPRYLVVFDAYAEQVKYFRENYPRAAGTSAYKFLNAANKYMDITRSSKEYKNYYSLMKRKLRMGIRKYKGLPSINRKTAHHHFKKAFPVEMFFWDIYDYLKKRFDNLKELLRGSLISLSKR